MPLQDNITVRADVPGDRFRVEKEGAFQVYLRSTLPLAMSGVKLPVDSDQFEGDGRPGAILENLSGVPAAAEGGAKGCFAVSLRRKAGSADDPPDAVLRLYADCGGNRFLAATLTLAEALDEHRVPFNPSLKIDGQTLAGVLGQRAGAEGFHRVPEPGRLPGRIQADAAGQHQPDQGLSRRG